MSTGSNGERPKPKTVARRLLLDQVDRVSEVVSPGAFACRSEDLERGRMAEEGLSVTAWDAHEEDDDALKRWIASNPAPKQHLGACLLSVDGIETAGFELVHRPNPNDLEFGEDHWEIRPCPEKPTRVSLRNACRPRIVAWPRPKTAAELDS